MCSICEREFNPEHIPGEDHKKPWPCIDHDHETGLPRGLLCVGCNNRLGGQGKELLWLNRAIEYILEHKQTLLSVKDKSAQDLLWKYAQRHRSIDSEFSDDLEQALILAGFDPKSVNV
jgi:Recombination endonuclease VII